MIELRVLDARQRDIARGIGRISQDAMQKLGVSAGQVIEIVGKKRTSVIVWGAYSEDQDKDFIRIDGFIRKNAGVAINDIVTVRPAEVKDASQITLEPVDTRLNVDEDFTNFVKHRLMERTFVEGDTTLVMMLGHPVQFMVSKTVPEGIVKMCYTTELQIKEKPREPPLDKETMTLSEDFLRRALKQLSIEKRDNTVMTRLSDDDLKQIDTLIGIGLFDSRSEAVAYLTHEGIAAKREMFEQLSKKYEQINKIREEAKSLVGTSAPITNLKACPQCGKGNIQESKFCSNCGQKLE